MDQAPPRLELLEICWQLVGPSGKAISCVIYAVDGPGVDVRAAQVGGEVFGPRPQAPGIGVEHGVDRGGGAAHGGLQGGQCQFVDPQGSGEGVAA